MVEHKIGNLLDAPVDYICHQVNCRGRMASGIAKQVRERWPEVYYDYMNKYFVYADCDEEKELLGQCQYINTSSGKTVVNMFAQADYGYDGQRYTSYDAFWLCLCHIKTAAPKGSKIGFPWKIGCGLGGANWQVISTMICEVLGKDYDVYIYQLEEEK